MITPFWTQKNRKASERIAVSGLKRALAKERFVSKRLAWERSSYDGVSGM
jgi:hypothetical protein